MNTLTATKRSKTDKLGFIRSNGMIPSIVYGAQVENTIISVSSVDFEKVLKVAGESSTITLSIKDESDKKAEKKVEVLIHDVQFDPVKGFPIHIDFLSIDVNKPIEVNIPIEFIGVAPAEKDGLGNLVKVMHEVEVRALPKDLPHSLSVDLGTLATLEDQIHVGSIVLPKGVEMVTSKEEVIALVTAIKEEKEEVPVDLSSIEVEKKGKKEEEGAAPEAESTEK